MSQYNHITRIEDGYFTVETVSGGCRLPCFRDIEHLEAHRRNWNVSKAYDCGDYQTHNQEMTQLAAYKLWQAHLEGEKT